MSHPHLDFWHLWGFSSFTCYFASPEGLSKTNWMAVYSWDSLRCSCTENLPHCHHSDRKRRFFSKNLVMGSGYLFFSHLKFSRAWALVWCPLKTLEVLLLYAACQSSHPAGQDHNHLHQWWKFSCNGLWHNRCWSDSIWFLSLLTKSHHYFDFTVFVLTTAEIEC